MSTRALVATDLSDASMIMVDHLSLLHDFNIESIILLQCYEYQQISDEMYPLITDMQQEMLSRQEAVLKKEGFSIKVETTLGHAKKEIKRVAERENVSLIVVGSQGRSLIGGAFLGSVAFEVMLNTTRPLFIFRLTVDRKGILIPAAFTSDGILSHPLFCVDFSKPNREAFERFLVMISTGSCREVTLAHVIEEDNASQEVMTIARQRLDTLSSEVKSVGVAQVYIRIESGKAHRKLLEIVDSEQISLAVLGTVGHTFFEELFAGSVSQYVARHASKSVFLIPKMTS